MRLSAFTGIFVSFLSPWAYGYGQDIQTKIVVAVNEPTATVESAARYLNGYRASIRGQTIEYHSSAPDVDSALIVRGQAIAHSISWRTDPIPKSTDADIEFVWLAGIECAGFTGDQESHTFDLLIDGQTWFRFRNAKDATAQNWKVNAHDGAELSFSAVTSDSVGDLFGYMILKVPGNKFQGGEPLTLEVRGDNSGSPDWYMAFQHPFSFVPQIRVEPALLKDGGRSSQLLRLSLDNLIAGRTIEIHAAGHETIGASLKIGSNVFQVAIPAVTSEVQWPFVFEVNGKVVESATVSVAPVKKRDIYLLSYSHNDLGYTDLQPDVERKQWNNLAEAMRLIRETRDYPLDARYKWNLENVWSLDSYLKRASTSEREEFFRDVREGNIGISALYANMLTGLANSVEMSHFFDFARKLRAEYHIPITTAVTSDVPGFSWGIVAALAQSGVKYFATAPNAGDRIGYTLEALGDKPFYWSSQSGNEKVLTWMAGASYSSFHEGTISKLGDDKIMKLMRKLDVAAYPFEIVQLPYTLADNGPPDPALSDFVRRWNERYVTPRLIVATHEQMFQEFEKRYGAALPVLKGDFTPYWEDGAASTAFETELNRAASDRLIQGEALWSMLSPTSYPADEYDSAWRDVILYDEHTWGAHNSIEEPELPFVKQQWKFKRDFAVNADRSSRELLARALRAAALPGKGKPVVDVYNTNSWPRTDVVMLSSEISAAGDRVVDLEGRPVPSQRITTGELAVLAENVPPFAAKRLIVEKGGPYTRGNAKVQGTALENDFIALSVNVRTGAVDNFTWKKNGTRLVNGASGTGLNQYLYVLGADPEEARGGSNVRVSVKEQGSLVVSLLVESDAPGTRKYSSEIRLVEGLNRLDVITNIDKQAVREKEGVHIAFPFTVPGGQVRYDVANGIVRPEADQLPGSCKNFFSVQSWVDVSNADNGVTVATPNSPLIEIGSITAELPWMRSIEPSSRIYSYVMNNYWHTNYKADQEGPITLNYSIFPHAAFAAIDAVKFGTERRQPLIVTVPDASVKPRSSFLRLTSPSILVSSIKPIEGGNNWLVYLYNPADKSETGEFRSGDGVPMAIGANALNGQNGAPQRDFEMSPLDSGYFSIFKVNPSSADHR
jgi:alpha-mannosidase